MCCCKYCLVVVCAGSRWLSLLLLWLLLLLLQFLLLLVLSVKVLLLCPLVVQWFRRCCVRVVVLAEQLCSLCLW